jgi:hypothetical protein
MGAIAFFAEAAFRRAIGAGFRRATAAGLRRGALRPLAADAASRFGAARRLGRFTEARAWERFRPVFVRAVFFALFRLAIAYVPFEP